MSHLSPTIGRIVHYRLAEHDVSQIRALPTVHLNPVQAGQVYPAVIVRAWGNRPDSAVNLQVLLDGQAQLWVTSRTAGDDNGTWLWPPRA
ncbi:hypothetical protein KV557_09950 [Kitasatospora aureofaciens]|uniref:hypothetical protein n=1 Tax=Kitasatospora aureofaciens TaxID=1894 RepID=UPI001C48FE97|nr:hypothetical protein [Kitasatospora aureofaciens]MBV6697446.1 hypothetical protein [Kitasatospora aureofaciens]